jgi:hypothetical protein
VLEKYRQEAGLKEPPKNSLDRYAFSFFSLAPFFSL